jgi:hypothetical protein
MLKLNLKLPPPPPPLKAKQRHFAKSSLHPEGEAQNLVLTFNYSILNPFYY